MSEDGAPLGGVETVVSVPVETPADKSPITASEAARQLANWRFKRDNPDENKPAEPQAEKPAEPPKELAETPDDAQPEEGADPVEPTKEAEPEPEASPIEPPRSWTKEAKERWESLPRETQEYLAGREQDREREFRRSQNEAAEKLKGLTAKEQAAEQARLQYEAALPALYQTLQDEQAGQFSDIKTLDDVTKLSVNDPFRYLQWNAHQQKMAGVQQEARAAQERQSQEKQNQFAQFVQRENDLAIERIPELADKTKASKLATQAAELLKDIGFTQTDLTGFSKGDGVSLYDHRMQSILHDALRYREAKAAIAKPSAKPVPPVQRPGTSKAPASAADAEVQNLQKAFERKPDAKNAAALLNAKRRSA